MDRILGDLGLGDTPRLVVMNKVDLLSPEAQTAVTRGEGGVAAIPVSARDRNTTGPLLAAVEMALWKEGRLATRQLIGGVTAAPAPGPSDPEPESDSESQSEPQSESQSESDVREPWVATSEA